MNPEIKPTHTPIDKIVPMLLEIRKDWNYQTGKQDYLICEKKGPWLFKTDNEYRAAFIVRACNAHEELLAALKTAKTCLKENRGPKPKEFMQIVEAISKAEGKE